MHIAYRHTFSPATKVVALLAAVAAALAVASPPASADHVAGSAIRCDNDLWDTRYHIDDTHPSIKYRGVWARETGRPGMWRGTQHISNEGGSTASFTMPYGAYQFALGFTKMRNAGIAAIYYNDHFLREIDMYAPGNVFDCALIFEDGVPPGTFMIKVLNRKNPASLGTFVNVDHVHFND